MSENNYQLVAWTENGEVKFSGVALWEQEMLLWDEYYSLYYSEDKGWERYSRLVHIAWQWGMLLLEMKEYWKAYGRFTDGLYACRDAMRFLHFPEDGGVHPFLLAMDDLLEGCHKAALEDDNLEEVYFEDSFRDIRRQHWEKTADPENGGSF
ncbi:MAG: hypothetical protein IJP49_09030 [Bacteroidales bacterium]|jgi:hypothetical protein|nr:hypothetical protein [Bacteroidales bacterium]